MSSLLFLSVHNSSSINDVSNQVNNFLLPGSPNFLRLTCSPYFTLRGRSLADGRGRARGRGLAAFEGENKWRASRPYLDVRMMKTSCGREGIREFTRLALREHINSNQRSNLTPLIDCLFLTFLTRFVKRIHQ